LIYQFSSRANWNQPVVNPTSNPQVFLFSAPACAVGSRMRVDFHSPDGVVTSTPYKACGGKLSMNFYLAGMYGATNYMAHSVIDDGSALQTGDDIAFLSGPALRLPFSNSVQTDPPKGVLDPVLLTSNGVATSDPQV
jgi:hypothetical protein